MPRAKKMPQNAIKFEAGEENRIVYESLYCEYGKITKLHRVSGTVLVNTSAPKLWDPE